MKIFSAALLDELAGKASDSPRRRAHHTIHSSAADPVQRFFVAANRDSYFRPHRHHTKSELALVLRGTVDVVTFDDQGAVVERYAIGEGASHFAYETPRAVWHTIIVYDGGAVFLEVKEGPYDPASAVEFASWAPAEGDPTAIQYLERLRAGA